MLHACVQLKSLTTCQLSIARTQKCASAPLAPSRVFHLHFQARNPPLCLHERRCVLPASAVEARPCLSPRSFPPFPAVSCVFLQDGTLLDELDRLAVEGSRLSTRQVLEIFRQVRGQTGTAG